MREQLWRRSGAGLVAVMMAVAAVGCTGTPQRRGGPGSMTGPGTMHGGTAGHGGMTSGTTGRTTTGISMRSDLGYQISGFVAGLDGVGGNWAGAGRGLAGGAAGAGAGTPGAGMARAGATGAGTTGAGLTRTAGPMVGPTTGTTGVAVSTLVIGNLAYVGIYPHTIRGRMAGGTAGVAAGGPTVGTAGPGVTAGITLEDQVRSRVRGNFPQVSDVYITTDPPLVYRIARVTGVIEAGLSTAPHLAEMYAIARQMTPTVAMTSTGAGTR